MNYVKRTKTFYFILIIPFFLVMCFLYVYPIFQTVRISFTNLNYAKPGLEFVGLKNYIDFFKSTRGLNILKNTILFTVVVVPTEIIFGLCIALLVNRSFKYKGIVRTFLIMPIMFAPVVAGYQWRWLFSDQYGLINFILQKLGFIQSPLAWLTTPGLATFSIILSDIWYSTPFVTVILLGALQSIPVEPYESAEVDGARGWQSFFYITLPLIKPGILAAILIRIMDAFQIFDLVFILTYGGPGSTTEMVNSYTYKTAFLHFRLGYASSVSIVALVVMVTTSLFLFRTINRTSIEI
jgi:multiple sugar transport system permease protein